MQTTLRSIDERQAPIRARGGLDEATVRPLIHMGYHKTGTSWLQVYLFGRDDRGFMPLAPQGIPKPKTRAKYLGKYFYDDGGGRLLPPFESRIGEVRDFLSGLDLSCGRVPVISSEGLAGNPHFGGAGSKDIANRLMEAFPQARIFIVIREQVSMILSTYFHFLRKGGFLTLPDYLGEHFGARVPRFTPAHYRYDRLIGYYQQLFGADNVLVQTYETFCKEPETFVRTLGDFSGADLPLDLEYERPINEGLPRVVEYHTRHLNPLVRRASLNGYSTLSPSDANDIRRNGLIWLRKCLAKAVPEGSERKFVSRVRSEIQETVAGYYTESNNRTAELTGLDLTALGYK
ncbi:MAG: sulfotransferase [Hyphomicrobiales bacterium]